MPLTDLQIATLVERYSRERDRFEKMAATVTRHISTRLRAAAVPHVPTFRSKDPDSLQGKLTHDREKHDFATFERELAPALLDLAGVRMMLYRPKDVEPTCAIIEELFFIAEGEERFRRNYAFANGYQARHRVVTLRDDQIGSDPALSNLRGVPCRCSGSASHRRDTGVRRRCGARCGSHVAATWPRLPGSDWQLAGETGFHRSPRACAGARRDRKEGYDLMGPRIADVANVLTRYRGRFDFLDAFADDIEEIRGRTLGGTLLRDAPNPLLAVPVGTTSVLVELFPTDGVVRFQLGGQPPEDGERIAAASLLGGILGTAVEAATDKKEGLLGGLVLGMLVGAALGVASKPVERVLALQFNPGTASWRLYDGALLRWAKHTLQPTAA